MVAVRCASPGLYWLRVDANSNLTSLTPPGRPAHAFTYDSRDLTTQYAPPAATPGGPTSYVYNADAQPTTTTRPDGDVITSGYDLAGRLSTLTIPRGSFGYSYDGPTGKLASLIGPGGSTRSYGYQGALLTSLTSGGPVAGSAAWTYDNNYRTTGRTVNGANAIAFGYDADDRTTAIGSLTLARNAQNGLLTGTTLGSVTDSLSYSTFGEVSSYSAGSLYSESYVRDDLGRITQRTEVLQGVTTVWGYSYDLSGRLVSVTRNGAAFEGYTYDANDNRLTKTTTAGTTTYAHDDQDRLLSATGPSGAEAWQYDANGDLLSHNGALGQTSFDYETSGQLLSVTRPGQVVSYDLDAGNKRAVKRVNGVAQRQWLYAGGLLPVAEYDGSGNLVAVFNGGFMVKNGTTYRLLRDHLGSVRLVVDASTGAVAQRLSYGPWGQVLEDTNPGFQPFGYAGGLYDPDTGLVRFGARDYDAGLGRFLSRDALMSMNRYEYANSNPANFVDRNGRYADVTTTENSDGTIDVNIEIPIEWVFQRPRTNAGPSEKAANWAELTATTQTFKDEIESTWTRDVGKYHVKCRVVTPEAGTPREKKNRITVFRKGWKGGDGRSRTGPYDGQWYSDYVGYNSSSGPHEIGHSLGLEDGYEDTSPFPLKPGYTEDNLMVRGGKRGRLEEFQIETIINKYGR